MVDESTDHRTSTLSRRVRSGAGHGRIRSPAPSSSTLTVSAMMSSREITPWSTQQPEIRAARGARPRDLPGAHAQLLGVHEQRVGLLAALGGQAGAEVGSGVEQANRFAPSREAGLPVRGPSLVQTCETFPRGELGVDGKRSLVILVRGNARARVLLSRAVWVFVMRLATASRTSKSRFPSNREHPPPSRGSQRDCIVSGSCSGSSARGSDRAAGLAGLADRSRRPRSSRIRRRRSWRRGCVSCPRE